MNIDLVLRLGDVLNNIAVRCSVEDIQEYVNVLLEVLKSDFDLKPKVSQIYSRLVYHIGIAQRENRSFTQEESKTLVIDANWLLKNLNNLLNENNISPNFS